jgi:hypothetical protein
MSTVIVKRFAIVFGGGGRTHYPTRRRSGGLFQLYHDDSFLGIGQPYQFDDKPISRLFADLTGSEAELLRVHPGLEWVEQNA